MPRHARKRRRFLAPGVDSLEGRRLLSHVVVSAPAESRAEIADHDDVHVVAVIHTEAVHPVTPIVVSAARPASSHVQSESNTADSSNDDADTPAALASDEFATPALTLMTDDVETDPTLLTGTIRSDRLVDPGRRSLPPTNNAPFGIAAVSSGAVDPIPATPAGQGRTTFETPPVPQESSDNPQGVGDSNAEIEAESTSMPKGAGLISHVLPFSGEILTLAVDEVLEKFEDLDILDAVGSIMTQPITAVGVACVATLGAVEIARRLHSADSEKEDKRTYSRAMVPGLRSARAT